MDNEALNRKGESQQSKPVFSHTDKLVISGVSAIGFGLGSLVVPPLIIPATASCAWFGYEFETIRTEGQDQESK